ncbi:MAG TPA: C45 family peptidase [Kofleriaceae bacterium]|nr:C45 family peptidase [Kofleriaceae bacterium]
MRTLHLPASASPLEWGRIHGETFRGEINSLADIRVYLTGSVGGFPSAAEVLRVARLHLPVLEAYDTALYHELVGIAEGAATSPERLGVLNHYTDLRDLDPSKVQSPAGDDAGGCSVLYAKAPGGAVLAQTWDMHATAIPYVMMIRTPGAWVLSLTGCLGMAGMNRDRVGIAINNLHSTDARVGVVWSALVRRALRTRTAAEARDLVLGSPVGSGHHYLVADPDHAFGIETSGRLREVIYDGVPPHYVHTNHCLLPAVAAVSTIPPTSTTHDRYAWLERSLAGEPIANVEDAWERLGSADGYPRSVCTNMSTPSNPHGTATCSAIAMNLATCEVLAGGGFIHNVAPERFGFDT